MARAHAHGPRTQAGLEVRHVSEGRNVPMYATNVQTESSGPFRGITIIMITTATTATTTAATAATTTTTATSAVSAYFGHNESLCDFCICVCVCACVCV